MVTRHVRYLISLLLMVTIPSWGQEEGLVVRGQVLSESLPLEGVNILVIGTTNGVKSDNFGNFTLRATENDSILFSYLGKTEKIIKVTKNMPFTTIVLEKATNQLDEVTVAAQKTNAYGEVITEMGKPEKVYNKFGEVDTRKSGVAINYIGEKEINKQAPQSMIQFLMNHVPNLQMDPVGAHEGIYLRGVNSIEYPKPVIFEVDGNIMRDLPMLDPELIKDIHVLKSYAATTKYGTEGSGGVIVINTKLMHRNKKGKGKNKRTNTYKGNAKTKLKWAKPNYLIEWEKMTDATQVVAAYKNGLNTFGSMPAYHLDALEVLEHQHQNRAAALEVLAEMRGRFSEDPENLKLVAFAYDRLNEIKKALVTYRAIFNLDPVNAQNQRNLAQAYARMDMPKNAWQYYKQYVTTGHPLGTEGLGKIVFDEMEHIYTFDKQAAQITDHFNTSYSEVKELDKDLRLVFEWVGPETEFEIEFVSPQKFTFDFNHTEKGNPQRIGQEITLGTASEAFFIDELNGSWLINLTFRGQPNNGPAYLKTTLYYNWARPSQKEVVHLTRMSEKGVKVNLLSLNQLPLAHQGK
ncbi:tetratricopeptide repeat protein [Sediminicola luteus]|nr:tetratricopeptide repeat protein [Sediminicola luteus]